MVLCKKAMKGYKKWFVIDTRHCLKKKKKKESGVDIDIRNMKIKEHQKKYRQNMPEEDKQKRKNA